MACTPSLFACSTVLPVRTDRSAARCSPVTAFQGQSATKGRPLLQSGGTIYSRTKETISENIPGETHCSLSKAVVSDSPLHQDLKLAFTSFCISAKKESNLIRDRQLKQSEKSFGVGKFSLIISHSLALVLGFSGKPTVHMQS